MADQEFDPSLQQIFEAGFRRRLLGEPAYAVGCRVLMLPDNLEIVWVDDPHASYDRHVKANLFDALRDFSAAHDPDMNVLQARITGNIYVAPHTLELPVVSDQLTTIKFIKPLEVSPPRLIGHGHALPSVPPQIG